MNIFIIKILIKIIDFISLKKKRNIIKKSQITEKKYKILFLFFNSKSFKIYIYIYKQINQMNNFKKFRNLNRNFRNLKIYIFLFEIYLIEI